MSANRNDEVKNVWDTNAAYWDERMGEGNDFHKVLVAPNQLELLDIKKGDSILDIACGNGQFARQMTELGARVTAIDFSGEMIKIARARPLADKIDYRVIDVTKKSDLAKLRGNIYDSIVCTMAIMDIENIEPLIGFLPEILKNNGRFVFSILHPCFNSGEASQVNEHTDYGGYEHNRYYVKIADYLISRSVLGVAIRGQPEPQYYFHRPLSEILNLCFRHGFYMDGIREPSFKDIEKTSTWGHVFTNNPPAIVCGFKLIK
ncbi:MAG: class I SAM-dependent methyltransferase [Dehalococcoidales bacterium]|nr:class I SAM-dependent methyltransferase [Dehalococcoidales bacterium]